MPEEIDRLLISSRAYRLEELGNRLLRGMDRSEVSLFVLRWELEEELNESLYVALDLLGWNRELLVADFKETQQDLSGLLEWFEAREEYEACAQARDLVPWLRTKVDFFLAEIDRGEAPASLIGL